jgi:transposase
LECYHDLRVEHTAWVQRVHAVLFHQGVPVLAERFTGSEANLAELRVITDQLSPVGGLQVATALGVLAVLDEQLAGVHRQLLAAARQLTGAKVLANRLYGVGPITALALTCWLAGAGRFSSARKAVRFTGLDVTVYSSAGKRSPGHLSRQGPGVLRWCVYEAGKTHARPTAPDHAYYAQVGDRIDGKRAAISEARKLIRAAVHILDELGDDALLTT